MSDERDLTPDLQTSSSAAEQRMILDSTYGHSNIHASLAWVVSNTGTPQVIPYFTPTSVTFVTPVAPFFDTASYWAAGSPTRLTVPATAYYQIDVFVSTLGGVSGHYNEDWQVTVRKNGTTQISPTLRWLEEINGAGAPFEPLARRPLTMSFPQPLTANDYLELRVLYSNDAAEDGKISIATFGLRRLS